MYRKFIDRYKKDERRPDVMWRRAMCLKDLEKHNEAREQLKELIKGYPQTPLAKDARETLQLYYRDFGGY
jgi:TolA-binding protein